MTLTRQELKGGAVSAHARHAVKDCNTKDITTATGTEVVVLGPIKVRDLRYKTVWYRNRSETYTHSVKVYHSPEKTMPTAQDDGTWKQIGSTATVSPETMSDPMKYDGDYMWMMVTATGETEEEIGDAYFMGSHD